MFTKLKPSKPQMIILFNNPIVCGCTTGLTSAFYPTLKNKNSKTFTCDYCGKVHYTSNLNLKGVL